MRGGVDIPVEAVGVLKEKYPGFDKPMWSRCRHPDKYGVRLTVEAEKLLREKGVEIPRRRRDKRSARRSNRITFRVPDAVFSALQRTIDASSGETMQDAVEKAVIQFLGGDKNK